jgi:hypothetical protein
MSTPEMEQLIKQVQVLDLGKVRLHEYVMLCTDLAYKQLFSFRKVNVYTVYEKLYSLYSSSNIREVFVAIVLRMLQLHKYCCHC